MNGFMEVVLWVTYFLSLYFTIFWIIVLVDKKDEMKKDERKKPELTRFPFISIVVPAYNEEPVIEKTLASIVNLDYPANKMEIIVVNDGSTDGTQQKVERFIKKHKKYNIALINQKNQGKAKSLNNALKILNGEFFACLDADSFVEKNTLKKMLAVYESEDDDMAIVTPALKVHEPKTILQRIQKVEYLMAMLLSRLMSHIDCLYIAPGPFSLYRTSIIKKLGGFDEKSLVEDQEIAYRAQKKHHKVKQCYDGYVHTIAPNTNKGIYKQRNRWYKGSVFNIIKYRSIILNKKYGDFGITQMSINSLAFFLSLSIIVFFCYYYVRPIVRGIHDLSLVNFDIMTYLQNMKLTFNLLSVNIESVVIISILLCISVFFIIAAYRNGREHISKNSKFIILYVFVYYVFMAFIIMAVLIEAVIGRKQKW